MGVLGRRINKKLDEPTLLGSISDIIKDAMINGFIKEFTVDIEAIVKKNGLKIVRDDLPSAISGYLKKVDDEWVIGVNKNHHPHRQRFTIAHEFAHYCLHKRDGSYFEDTTFFRKENDSSIEFKANEFAAELLMPAELIHKAIKKTKKIVDLAELFKLSVQALKLRAKELGYNIKTNG